MATSKKYGPRKVGMRRHQGVVADEPTVMVRVADPVPPETVPGMEQVVAVRPLLTLQVKAILPVKDPNGLTLMVAVLEEPGLMETLVGLEDISKSSFH